MPPIVVNVKCECMFNRTYSTRVRVLHTQHTLNYTHSMCMRVLILHVYTHSLYAFPGAFISSSLPDSTISFWINRFYLALTRTFWKKRRFRCLRLFFLKSPEGLCRLLSAPSGQLTLSLEPQCTVLIESLVFFSMYLFSFSQMDKRSSSNTMNYVSFFHVQLIYRVFCIAS